MSMTGGGAGSRFEIGPVISDTFAVIQRNFKTFGLGALLLVAAPSLVSSLINFVFVAAAPSARSGFSPISSLIGLVAFALGLVFQAGLFFGTVSDLTGQPTTLKAMLAVGGRKWLPLLGMTILVGIPTYIGLIFLIVPGVIFFLRWSMAGPVLAVENRGVLASLGRSAALTKGRRGAIFLIGLVLAVILLVLEMVVFGLMGGAAGVMALATHNASAMTPAVLIGLLIVAPILAMTFTIFMSVLGATIYHHLRVTREGFGTETVAEVFA